MVMVISIHTLSETNRCKERIYGLNFEVEEYVRKIMDNIKVGGDRTLIEYTEKFDKVKISRDEIEIPRESIREALFTVPEDYIAAIKELYGRLLEFHRMQLPRGFELEIVSGVRLEFRWIPLDRVGLYVPGGLHPYPSTVLMASAPARVAGVREVVVCTPPRPKGLNPYLLAAFATVGVDRVFQVGGVQAIAAMAFGTETIPRVDKIVGPGNVYVAAAKRLLYGIVGLDAPTGPSEIIVLTDGSARARYVALDLIAQLEHGPGSRAILLTLSRDYALEVARIIENYLSGISEESIFIDGLAILVASDLDEALDFIRSYAPEHLEVYLKEPPVDLLERCQSCGTVLIGSFSSAALSDYATGGNHILPVGGSGRFSSALSVYDFMKHITVQNVSYEGFKRIAKAAIKLAEVEGFQMHRKAIESRLEGESV
ncbi:MAG: histidinol dehydrogenase [Candidatus Bathyarchaeota archaeon]|nr:histidinol dehydrogenase [Candidatus Bathyarchaeota archaeon]